MTLRTIDLKETALKLREETGQTAFNCRKALMSNDLDYERAKAFLKMYSWDSHGFKYEIGTRYG